MCAPCIYIFYIWHTHIHALMNNSDIQTCLRLVIWCVHVNSGSIPGPTIAAIAIRDVIPGSHFHSTVVFLGSPLGIRIENQSSKPSKDIQGSRGLRMFSSTNLRRVIMIVSTMPSTSSPKSAGRYEWAPQSHWSLGGEGKYEETNTMFQPKAGVNWC